MSPLDASVERAGGKIRNRVKRLFRHLFTLCSAASLVVTAIVVAPLAGGCVGADRHGLANNKGPTSSPAAAPGERSRIVSLVLLGPQVAADALAWRQLSGTAISHGALFAKVPIVVQ